MDDLDVLARDFGFRPQGKSAPMRSTTATSSSPVNDVFGGPSKSTFNDFDYDSIFKNNNNDYDNSSSSRSRNASKTTSDFPVFDKPVYDDDDGGGDIFDGLPGMKSKSMSSSSKGVKFEDGDVFGSMGASGIDQFDDLLGNFGRNRIEERNVGSMQGMDDFLGGFRKNEKEVKSSGSLRDFDDLLGGFGSESSGIGNRPTNVSPHPPKQTSPLDEPFVVLDSTSPISSSSGVFTEPLKDMSKLGKSGNTKVNTSSMSGGSFDDIDPLNGFNKSVPPFSPDKDGRESDESPSKSRPGHSQKKVPVDSFQESPLFDIPSVSTDPKKSFGQNVSSPPQYSGASHNEKNFQADVSPRSEELPNSSGDVWLSVSEVPLFTQPTKSPPPSRPPPPIPRRTSKAESGYFSSSTRKAGEDYFPSYNPYTDTPKPRHPEENKSSASQIDDLEDFSMGRSQNNVHPGEDMDAAAAAMKEAMDRAEAKFKHAKEVRDREHAKAAKSKENFQAEKDDRTTQDAREREYRENQERLELERRQKEKEEEEREQRRLEKERTERERARQAVERATREARERAAADARERAAAEARLKAERAAVGKAQAEARERAGKAAVQRVQAEARERAAAEAKERAEKAAAEAREKSTSEAREKEAREKAEAQRRSQRAAVERAAAEARERAAADSQERAANAARATQQNNENDLESFFSSRPSSVPKARTSSSDPFFDQFQNKGGSDSAKRTSSSATSNIKKTSSATNIVDDLSSIFGAPSSSGNFQDIEGETEERRRARLERHQRTQERAAKALAEKNQRDMQVQRDQEERNRMAESLDFEVKRWAAGKEGNLRALLSTLQYVSTIIFQLMSYLFIVPVKVVGVILHSH
ncbi:hypothetical protein Leryth_000812 [Lithospermum erythrorhizon]|nr:hypothetical protein Leryth_000812 [Lithospermum erythrorhizon]